MTDATLTRARAGDEEAFRSMTDPYRRELQLHCYRILGSVKDAEDLLQDLAARGGVLSGQRVEQVEGVVVIEGARSPRSHPGTVPVASHDVRRRAVGRP